MDKAFKSVVITSIQVCPTWPPQKRTYWENKLE